MVEAKKKKTSHFSGAKLYIKADKSGSVRVWNMVGGQLQPLTLRHIRGILDAGIENFDLEVLE